MKIGISIPTYNEVTNIGKILPAIKSAIDGEDNLTVHLLVVDDNSPDGTADEVLKYKKKLESTNFKIDVLVRLKKDGFGKACIAGFKRLMELRVDYILQMDADLSHDPAYIHAFIKAARNNNDFIVGSRYIKGGQTPDWPLHRRLLSRYGNLYTKIILGNKISDYTGGFNLYSVKLLKEINLDSLHSAGYGFLIELKFRAIKKSQSVYQIPIIFKDREHGQSKIPKSTLVKNLILVPRLRISNKNQ